MSSSSHFGDSIHEHIYSALAVFRLQSVRRFLLGTDPHIDAEIVTSPAPQSRAVGTYIISESSAPIFDGCFDFNVLINWLMIPAYNVEEFTLGVLVSKRDSGTRTSMLRPGLAQTSYLRSARDNKNGVYVTVGHYGGEEGVEVTCISGSSDKRRRHRHRSGIVFRFKPPAFYDAMNIEGDSPHFDVAKLVEALVLAYAFEEDRFCPMCEAPPNTLCECNPMLLLKQLQESHCSNVVRRNLQFHRGQYIGVAYVSLLASGVPIKNMQMLRRTTVELMKDRASECRLIEWAARDRLHRLKPNVSRMTMPGGETDAAIISRIADESLLVESSDPVSPNPVSQCTLDVAGDHYTQDLDDPGLSPPPISYSEDTCKYDLLRSISGPSSVIDVNSPGDIVVQAEVVPALNVADETASKSSAQRGPQTPIEQPAAKSKEGEKSPDTNSHTRSSADEMPEVILKGLEVVTERGGPRNITPEELLKLVPMDQKDIAKVFRKARNREAAAKSNEKRKIRLQNLKADLKDIRRRKIECADRIAFLKKENHDLYAALQSMYSMAPQPDEFQQSDMVR